MEGKAIAKSVRISPIKARLVIDLIRGKKIDEAVTILENRNKKSSGIVLKVLNSAVAKTIRIAPLKTRLVIDLIRGKSVS